MDQENYDVFISYSRSDYVYSDKPKKIIPGNVLLKIKDVLTKAGFSYWFDEEGIDYGEEWAGIITEAIQASKMLLFVSSENANKSRFTKKEIFIAQQYNKPIIPFRLDTSSYNTNVNLYLADIQYIAYYENPEKGIIDLVGAVRKTFERLHSEEEKLMQKQIQERLFSEISISVDALNTEVRKIEIERRKLLLRAEEIKDKSKQAAIISALGLHDSEKREGMDIESLKRVCIGLIAGITIGVSGMAFFNRSNQEPVAHFTVARDTTYIVKDSTIVIDFGPESMRHYQYSGPIKVSTKLPEGYGIAHFEKSTNVPASKYEGVFVNGLCDDSGEAKLVFTENMGIYQGSFSNGYYAKGKFTDASGAYYLGTYKNGKPWDGASYDSKGNEKVKISGGKPI